MPAYGLASFLARVHWFLAGPQRKAVTANLKTLNSNQSAYTVFQHFAWYLIEFFALGHQSDPEITVQGQQHLAEAGVGAIILTAHLGNWELGAHVIKQQGGPVDVVALKHASAKLNRLFDEQREALGLNVITLSPRSGRESLKSLKRSHRLGILGDKVYQGQSVTVPWFSGTRALPSGPAFLSLRTKTPIVPAFLIRLGKGRFCLYVEKPIVPETSTAVSDDAVKLTVMAYAKAMSSYIQRFPEQWLVFEQMQRK